VHTPYQPQQDRLVAFVERAIRDNKKMVILEIGCGFNTPVVTRMPAESIAREAGAPYPPPLKDVDAWARPSLTQGGQPWRVCCRFLRDAKAHNEFGDERDYVEEEDAKADALQKQRNELDRDYGKEYTKWYKMSAQLADKMGRMQSCQCKAASLLSERRQLGHMAPDKKTMYEIIAKVDKCEALSEVLSNDISEQQQKNRKAVLQATSDIEALKRRMAEGERLAKIADQGSIVQALKRGRDVLKDAVETQKAQVEDYAERNSKLKKRMETLEEELTKCGC